MSEIPADILEIATAIVDRIAKQHFLKGDCVADVAQAIHHERQRHAEVMEEVRKVLLPLVALDPHGGLRDEDSFQLWTDAGSVRAAHALLSRLEER